MRIKSCHRTIRMDGPSIPQKETNMNFIPHKTHSCLTKPSRAGPPDQLVGQAEEWL